MFDLGIYRRVSARVSSLIIPVLMMALFRFTSLLHDPDSSVQSEMLNILRNIACNEALDIELVVRGIGEARLFSRIEEVLWSNTPELLIHVNRRSPLSFKLSS